MHQLGVGVLGPVFRTYDPDGDRLVAVKAFQLDLTPEQVEIFVDALREIVGVGLSHPAIIAPIAAGLEAGIPYLAQEYVAAESLDVAMRHYAPARPERALTFVTQLAAAVDAAHADGVVHGALHLRDVFVTPDRARVTGFGVASALEHVGLRVPIRRPYTAPELIAGRRWGPAADRFAVAAIAYELLTGRRAAGPGDEVLARLMAVDPDEVVDPAGLQQAFRNALAEDPTLRQVSGAGFVAAVREAVGAPGGDPEVSGAVARSDSHAAADSARIATLLHDLAPGERAAAAAGNDADAAADSGADLAALDRVLETLTPPTDAAAPDVSRPDAVARVEATRPARGADLFGDSRERDADDGADEDEDEAAAPDGRARASAAEPVRTVGDAIAAYEADEDRDPDLDRYRDVGDAAASVNEDADEDDVDVDPVVAGADDDDLDVAFDDVDDDDDDDVIDDDDDAVAPVAAVSTPVRVATEQRLPLVPPDFDMPEADDVPASTRTSVRAMAPVAIAMAVGVLVAYVVSVGLGTMGDDAEESPPPPVAREPAPAVPADETPAEGAGRAWSERAVDRPAAVGGDAVPAAPPAAAAAQSPAPPPTERDPPPPPPAPEPAPAAGAPAPPVELAPMIDGRILVRTNPPGATIEVDGVGRGVAPLSIAGLSAGPHRVTARAPGYAPAEQEVTLSADAPIAAVRADLVAMPGGGTPPPPAAGGAARPTPTGRGSLFVDSRPTGATVLVDDRRVGVTPMVVSDVAAGARRVRLERDGYRPWSTTIDVGPEQRVRVAASLEPGGDR